MRASQRLRRPGRVAAPATLLLGMLLALGLHAFPCSAGTSAEGDPPSAAASVASGRVDRVIDGDTFVLESGETVRLIGVDTPESTHPEIPVQRFSKEAAEFLRRLVKGFEVELEIGTPARDTYHRLLAYVTVDGTPVNEEIIRRGYGYALTRFPHPRMDAFIQAEREARVRQAGLWNYSLTDARITNLVDRYDRLSPQGKARLDSVWDELLALYPAPGLPGGTPVPPGTQQPGATPAPPARTASPPSGVPVIVWRDADRYTGRRCTVEGRIVATRNTGKACFLNFHENWKKYLSVVIFANRFPRFPRHPEEYYRDKTVRVTGWIKEYQGKPEIILEDPDQIEIVDAP